MPRGIPNVKRDETGMKYTSFHVPMVANPKHMSTTYLKSESQTLWARNAKNKVQEETPAPEQRRGSQVIVIHPGSRHLRIGRATDVTPITVQSVVARKWKGEVPPPSRVNGLTRPKDDGEMGDEQFDEKVSAVVTSLRDRMRFYKLRVTPNSSDIASTFNSQFKPEIIAEYNDPYRVEWTGDSEEAYIGEQALNIADPQKSGYMVRWPIHGRNFNTRDYPSLQLVLSDIEFLLRKTLKERMDIDDKDFKAYSVILVIPDLYDRAYVRELVNLLLINMGFKQICAQQESLAATYGAGISNACVVNVGATTTNIGCVDEGVVIPDTRLSLNVGGDDITEFLYVLLRKVSFPYRDLDLAKSYDWKVMEDLKYRLCTLAEGDVALNLYDFVVRRPDRPTEKYGLRAYDEIILAPMCLFEPRVMEFERKRAGFQLNANITDEIIELPGERITNAMVISTQHLMPAAPKEGEEQKATASTQEEPIDLTIDEKPPANEDAAPTISQPEPSTAATEPAEGENNAAVKAATVNQTITPANPAVNPTSEFPGGYAIDVCFEASKLPLDVAIFNSARAAGGDDRIRKYLQAVLVIGGTAHIPGMGYALESRLQAIATPLVPNMEKVQIIPPPKEVDPMVLSWKGGAVLGKMEGVNELWVTRADWDILGMRGLKERCFYL